MLTENLAVSNQLMPEVACLFGHCIFFGGRSVPKRGALSRKPDAPRAMFNVHHLVEEHWK